MTKQETNKLLSVIYDLYPSFRKDRDPAIQSEIWSNIFKVVPYEQMELALMEYYLKDLKGFPPVPGALRAILIAKSEHDEMSEMEAWLLLIKAISRSTYYSKQEFEKLPPMVQHIVGSPENLHAWAAMDENYVQHTLAPMFRRAYASRLEAKRQQQFLPADLLPRLEDGIQ